MPTLNVYLTFKGNCEEAFEFYKSVFGGDYTSKMRFSEMPPDPEYPVPEENKDKIMHVSLPMGESTVLMGSDTGGSWGPETVIGNNFSLSISVASKTEADDFHAKLSAGGNVTMPMDSTFWGDYFGMCTDKFGISWMISFTEQKQ